MLSSAAVAAATAAILFGSSALICKKSVGDSGYVPGLELATCTGWDDDSCSEFEVCPQSRHCAWALHGADDCDEQQLQRPMRIYRNGQPTGPDNCCRTSQDWDPGDLSTQTCTVGITVLSGTCGLFGEF
jgi:hypothetical protein